MSTVSQATDAIYNRLHSTSQTPLYHPSSADLFTDWNYEAGDVISIKSDNASYKTPLYKTQLKWTGAPKLTVTASGNKERDQIVEMKRREYASSTSNYSNQKSLRGGMGAAQSGVKEIDGRLYQAGLSIDPVTGLFMYQTVQGDGFALGASLKIQDGKINAKADSTVVDALSTRVGNAEIAIDGANAQIALKASQTTVDALGTRVSQAEIDIDGAEAAIALKVSKGDISTQLAVECGNVSISGGNLVVDGYISAAAAKSGTVEVNVLGLGNYIAGSDGQAYRPHFITMGGSSSSQIASQKFLGNGDLELAHYHAITAVESGGNITITLGAVQSTPGTADFEIAATTTYKDGVAAAKKKMGVKIDTSEHTVDVAESATKSAYIASLVELTYNANNHKYVALSKATANGTTVNTDTKTSGTEAYEAGWDAACDKIKREGNSIIGPKKGDVGKTETKYTANYVASTYTKETTETQYYTALATPSSYSASTHSRTGASVTIPGHGTITSTQGVTVTNLSGVISFNAGSDSYKSSSYEAETTAVSSYTKLKTSSIYKNSTFSWS